MDSKKTSSYSKDRPKLHVPQRNVGTSSRGHTSGYATPPATMPPKESALPGKSGDTPSVRPAISFADRFHLTRRRLVIGLIVICSGLLISQVVTHGETEDPAKVLSASDPEYQTLLPGEKSITELGGWKRISPQKNAPVFAYADRIGAVPISVSQQPIPESFKGDVENKTAELAKKFNATTKLSAGNTYIYVGTSAKGPQSAIVTKNDLLILIKSQSKVEDSAWTQYAESLN